MGRRSSRAKRASGRGARASGDGRRATDRVPAVVDEPRGRGGRRGERDGHPSSARFAAARRDPRASPNGGSDRQGPGGRRRSNRQDAAGGRRRSNRLDADERGGQASSRRSGVRGRAKSNQRTVIVIGAISAVLLLLIGLGIVAASVGGTSGGPGSGGYDGEAKTLYGRMQQAIRSRDLDRIRRVESEYKRWVAAIQDGDIAKPADYQHIQALSRGLRDVKSELTAP